MHHCFSFNQQTQFNNFSKPFDAGLTCDVRFGLHKDWLLERSGNLGGMDGGPTSTQSAVMTIPRINSVTIMAITLYSWLMLSLFSLL